METVKFRSTTFKWEKQGRIELLFFNGSFISVLYIIVIFLMSFLTISHIHVEISLHKDISDLFFRSINASLFMGNSIQTLKITHFG